MSGLIGRSVVAKFNKGYGGIVVETHYAGPDDGWLLLIEDPNSGELFTEWAGLMQMNPPRIVTYTPEESDGIPTEEVPFR